MEKSSDAFRTISEVADDLDLPQHVLRFWETRFPHIRPLKRAGGRRYYRPADVVLLRTIRQLLYNDGYTIRGVQRLLKEQGPRGLRAGSVPAPGDLDDRDLDDVAAGGPDAFEPETRLALAAAPAEPSICPSLPRPRADRAALIEMLATLEECTRILASLRRGPA